MAIGLAEAGAEIILAPSNTEILYAIGAGAYVIRYRLVDPTSLAIIRVSHVSEVPD